MRLIIIMILAMIAAVVLPFVAIGYYFPAHTDGLIVEEFKYFGGDTSDFNEEGK